MHAKPSSADALASVKDFAAHKLANASRSAEPFPWLELDKFLPVSLMNAVNQYFPGEAQMVAMPERRSVNAYARRYRRLLQLNKASLVRLSPAARSFWETFDRLIQALVPDLMNALMPPPQGQRYMELPVSDLGARIDLWADRGGYQISPHTDAPHKLATFLLYCSPEASLQNEGTSIFVPKDGVMRCWAGSQWPFELFSESHTTPYGCNRLFGFRKTDASFHGKSSVAETVVERRTVSITIQSNEDIAIQA
ncbi:hypothetical protein [Vulcanococcus limneticus]|uniref:hypothetical protein n=1 Tax=Vulcanococcus limneticus TaxID=2170428 RepID=UPI00398C0135